jgi:hypothetical protein
MCAAQCLHMAPQEALSHAERYCTGEVMITETFKIIVYPARAVMDVCTTQVIREILADEPGGAPSLVNPVTAKRLREAVIPDESTHNRFGRVILERYCTTDDLQRRALHVQDTKMAALRLSPGGLVTRALAH